MFLESTEHLLPNSNKYVEVSCDECYEPFARQFQLLNRQTVHRCASCNKNHIAKRNAEVQGGKPREFQRGNKHPRWNPNGNAFKRYANRVHWLTSKVYDLHKDEINPLGLRRTICGVDGGVQLDHKLSIKEAFLRNLPPELVAVKENLQLLPWKDNRIKGCR